MYSDLCDLVGVSILTACDGVGGSVIGIGIGNDCGGDGGDGVLEEEEEARSMNVLGGEVQNRVQIVVFAIVVDCAGIAAAVAGDSKAPEAATLYAGYFVEGIRDIQACNQRGCSVVAAEAGLEGKVDIEAADGLVFREVLVQRSYCSILVLP